MKRNAIDVYNFLRIEGYRNVARSFNTVEFDADYNDALLRVRIELPMNMNVVRLDALSLFQTRSEVKAIRARLARLQNCAMLFRFRSSGTRWPALLGVDYFTDGSSFQGAAFTMALDCLLHCVSGTELEMKNLLEKSGTVSHLRRHSIDIDEAASDRALDQIHAKLTPGQIHDQFYKGVAAPLNTSEAGVPLATLYASHETENAQTVPTDLQDLFTYFTTLGTAVEGEYAGFQVDMPSTNDGMQRLQISTGPDAQIVMLQATAPLGLMTSDRILDLQERFPGLRFEESEDRICRAAVHLLAPHRVLSTRLIHQAILILNAWQRA